MLYITTLCVHVLMCTENCKLNAIFMSCDLGTNVLPILLNFLGKTLKMLDEALCHLISQVVYKFNNTSALM